MVRKYAIDHLIVWHNALEVSEHTLFLAAFIFDKYTHVKEIKYEETIPILLTSLFIAIKFEETNIYSCKFFVRNSGIESMDKPYMLDLEADILSMINFDMIFICPFDIIKRLVYIFKSAIQLGNY